METKKDLLGNKELIFLILVYIVGLIGHFFSSYKSSMLLLTPYILLLTGMIVLINTYYHSHGKLLIWSVSTYSITFFLEVLGVKTGLIFGNYEYGSTLGLKLFEVPLIIGFNWVLVILGSICAANLITEKRTLKIFYAAFFATLFDFVLEPIAIELDYWKWLNDIIPIQNYIAWFIIASLSAFLFFFLRIKVNNKLPLYYLIIQFIFLSVLNLL